MFACCAIDQGLDQLALLDEIELDLGLAEQFLDPVVELRLEGGARHRGRRGDVHVFEDERLDLRLCGLDRGAVGVALPGGLFGFRLRDRRAQQRLHQRRDQIAAFERVDLDPVPREIGLHRGLDDLGKLAPAQDQASLGADFAI